MDESQWIERFVSPLTTGQGGALPSGWIGPGDDAAVIPTPPGGCISVSTDSLVEGTHFLAGWLDDAALARRLLLVSISDLSAMGAAPMGALLSVETPELPGRVGEQFWEGLRATSDELHCPILGGNVTRTSGPLALTCTVLGSHDAERSPFLRSTALPGQQLWVTGRPGLAALGLAALREGSRDARLVSPWVSPRYRGDVAARMPEGAAVIDLSDGLAIDLHRLLHASGVGARLELGPIVDGQPELAPEMVLGGGEDYELLMAATRDGVVSAGLDDQLTCIGHVEAGSQLEIAVRGEPFTGRAEGWDPFRT